MKKGVKKGTIRGEYNKYTDAEIIDVISEYETIKDLRASDDKAFYSLALRRGLREHLPTKRTRAMNIVGSALEKKLLEQEEKPVKEPRPKKIKKQKPVKVPKLSKGVQVYKHTFVDGVKICGRCFINKPKTERSVLCKDCNRVYARKHAYELPHVPWNLKQEYSNTTIRHYEKTFELGIKVDEKLERYLTIVGYSFLFQEPWENIWK
jgi:hypothetical protein